MGYFVCPKCNSRDSFDGTAAVSVTKQGPKIIGEFGDSGVYGAAGHSSTEVKTATVRKCRDCGEILSEKDYRLTPKEIEKQSALEEEVKEEAKAFWKAQGKFALRACTFLILAIICVGAAVGLFEVDEREASGPVFVGIILVIWVLLLIFLNRRWKASDSAADTDHPPPPVLQQEVDSVAKVGTSEEVTSDSNRKKRDEVETVLPDSSRATHGDLLNPKCENIRNEEGTIIIDCPHCGTDSQIDKRTLIRVWEESPEGLITCPVDECAKKYVAPTLHEISKLD